jgi:pilus assembly protein CpaD
MRQQKLKNSPHIKLIVLGGLAALFLGACTTYHPSEVPTPLRNKITVAETVERLELYAQTSGLNLSARDRDAVSDFVNLYGQFGQGPMYINIPGNSANEMGAKQAKSAITARMQRMGIPGSAVQMGQYAADSDAPAPVVVSFRRLTTVPINCQQGASLTSTSTNQPYNNFGCAQTANLAAMIDNPRQLLAPYALSPSTMIRRSTVIDNYANGEPTETSRPEGQAVSAGGN